MIVHQDISLHQALQSLGDATYALEMVEHLTNMQQWSDRLRKERLDHSRMCWEQHVAQLNHEGYFVNEYMMSLSKRILNW